MNIEVGTLEEKIYDEFVNSDWECYESKEHEYKIFYNEVSDLVYASNLEDFTKDEIIEMLKKQIEELEENL